MNQFVIRFCFCVLFSFSAALLFAGINSGEYRLVWEDTFEGPELDETTNWVIETIGDGGNNEYQRYRRENISVGIDPTSGKSCLIIASKKENYNNYQFTSGRLKTEGKISFKYGKVEGRIKLPRTANGLWPAFWMMGADYSQVGWPKCGEIDILETGNAAGIANGTQDRYFNGHFHWGESWNGGAYPNWGKSVTNDYGIQDDEFHLYTLEWDRNSIKMFLDQDKYPDKEPYLELGISGSAEPGDVARYFHKPFYIILNVAVGGNLTGITGNSNVNKITALNEENNFEARMYVDYVRVYQKGEEGEEFHGPGSVSGIKEPSFPEQRYSVYPNPAADYIKVRGEDTPARISVINLVGSVISDKLNSDYLDVSGIRPGNYLLRIETKEGNVEVHKFLKDYK